MKQVNKHYEELHDQDFYTAAHVNFISMMLVILQIFRLHTYLCTLSSLSNETLKNCCCSKNVNCHFNFILAL